MIVTRLSSGMLSSPFPIHGFEITVATDAIRLARAAASSRLDLIPYRNFLSHISLNSECGETSAIVMTCSATEITGATHGAFARAARDWTACREALVPANAYGATARPFSTDLEKSLSMPNDDITDISSFKRINRVGMFRRQNV